jgi:hypothetical protein
MRRLADAAQVLALLCAGCGAYAQSRQESPVGPDMLEFLGEWATDDGGWIDPQAFGDEAGDEGTTGAALTGSDDETQAPH